MHGERTIEKRRARKGETKGEKQRAREKGPGDKSKKGRDMEGQEGSLKREMYTDGQTHTKEERGGAGKRIGKTQKVGGFIEKESVKEERKEDQDKGVE